MAAKKTTKTKAKKKTAEQSSDTPEQDTAGIPEAESAEEDESVAEEAAVAEEPAVSAEASPVEKLARKAPTTRLAQFLASEVVGKITKRHGSTILLKASDHKVQKRPRIPTGVFPLDYALGGGIPAGLISTMIGHKSSGKTTTLLRVLRNAQNMCSECYCFLVDEEWGCHCKKVREFVTAYMDVEGSLDLPWVRSVGVDTDRLILSVPEYAEQTLDIIEAMIRSGDVDVIVLDSLAFLSPQKEIDESIEKDLMGVQARAIGKGIRKFGAALNSLPENRRPTILFTNQIRMKIGVMFGNPETAAGGLSHGFAAATETKLWAGKTEMDEVTGKPIHVEINFRIEKNKTAGPKMDGNFKIYTSDTTEKKKGDFYDEDQIVDWGEKTGLIHRSSGIRCNGEVFKVKDDLESRLKTDPRFKAMLVNDLLKVMLDS
jgi:recombination protein RecA